MNPPRSYEEAVAMVRAKDGRYHEGAFLSLRAGLDFAVELYVEKGSKHVHAHQLYDGYLRFVWMEYGCLTESLLNYWGVRSSKDLGEMVYLLIGIGVFGSNEKDTPRDFDGLTPISEVLENLEREKYDAAK